MPGEQAPQERPIPKVDWPTSHTPEQREHLLVDVEVEAEKAPITMVDYVDDEAVNSQLAGDDPRKSPDSAPSIATYNIEENKDSSKTLDLKNILQIKDKEGQAHSLYPAPDVTEEMVNIPPAKPFRGSTQALKEEAAKFKGNQIDLINKIKYGWRADGSLDNLKDRLNNDIPDNHETK